MKIHNVRLGHACNSSSSHSIVPLAALGGRAGDNYETGEFGWSAFMLATPQAKMEYLAATLASSRPYVSEGKPLQGISNDRITALTGITPDPNDEWGGFGYVDHQSLMALPVEGPHADLFLSDLADYLKRDDVVILGGNDNDGPGMVAHLPLPLEDSPARLRPGTAPDGSRYWTVMDGWRGDRVRFSFDGQPLSGSPMQEYDEAWERHGITDTIEAEPLYLPYADAPELVDMKVTGYCPFEKDCPWCYMGSTKDGQHASAQTANAWLAAFHKAGVFEIALGGGEPTLWPHLSKFVKQANDLGVNVNLTTKNIAWLKPGNLAGLSAIAVSVNNRRDLDRLVSVDLASVRGEWPDMTEITVQCVPAFCDDDLLRDLIAYAVDRGLRITFLGVKRTGRAAGEERADDLRWLELLKPYREDWWMRRGVAVDTLMAEAADDAFKALGVDPVWYETTEGRFSCYVDATSGRVAASSYVPDHEHVRCGPAGLLDGFHAAQRIAGLRS